MTDTHGTRPVLKPTRHLALGSWAQGRAKRAGKAMPVLLGQHCMMCNPGRSKTDFGSGLRVGLSVMSRACSRQASALP